MRLRQTLSVLGAAAVCALVLTACTNDDDPVPTATGDVEPTTTTPAETLEPTTATEAAAFVTPPGSALSIGDTAVLAHPNNGSASGAAAHLSATVNGIERARAEDLAELELGDRLEGLTPYLVYITLAGVDDTSATLAGTSLSTAFTGTSSGESSQNLTVVGDFDACDAPPLPAPWDAATTHDICAIALVPVGSVIDSVSYAPGGSDYFDDPVTWE